MARCRPVTLLFVVPNVIHLLDAAPREAAIERCYEAGRLEPSMLLANNWSAGDFRAGMIGNAARQDIRLGGIVLL